MSIADKYTTLTTEKIPKVYEAGYEKGKAEGGGGNTEAYEQGVADGKKSEYDSFWDAYQERGGPQQYVYSFAGRGWDDRTFKPKYDIIMRYSCLAAFQYNEVTDIAQALLDCGVTLDTSGASNLQGAFGYSKTKRLPVISAEGANSATGIFEECTELERIEKFVLVKKNVLTSAFKNCTKLKDIVFEGEIGYNTDLQHSPLSKDSITSVLGVLSDTTSGLTLTLNRAAVENAFSNALAIPFGFTTDLEGTNVTVVDNGDGTVTVNGVVTYDTEFEYREAEVTFPAGSYIISEPVVELGYSDLKCYDLDGNRLTTEYVGEISGFDEWALNTDKSFVVKACVYLSSGDYTDYIISHPTIRSNSAETPFADFAALIAEKPNWNIILA